MGVFIIGKSDVCGADKKIERIFLGKCEIEKWDEMTDSPCLYQQYPSWLCLGLLSCVSVRVCWSLIPSYTSTERLVSPSQWNEPWCYRDWRLDICPCRRLWRRMISLWWWHHSLWGFWHADRSSSWPWWAIAKMVIRSRKIPKFWIFWLVVETTEKKQVRSLDPAETKVHPH